MNHTEITNEQRAALEALARPAMFVAHDTSTHDLIAQDSDGAFYRVTPEGMTTRGMDKVKA